MNARRRTWRTARGRLLAVGVVGGLVALASPAAAVDPSRIESCRPLVLFKGQSESGRYSIRASSIQRSAAIRCSMTQKLLRAAYGSGPLRVTRTVYEHDSHGRPVGRPTYWVRGGWRCGNGAGGAACFNALKPQFNAIPLEGASHDLAVTANVG